jgi:hypothetical protein
MHEIMNRKFYLGPKFGTLFNNKWITISELLQKCCITPLEYLLMLSFADICLLILCLCGTIEKIGESWKFREPNTEDPLLATVDLLESNWKLIQNVLQLTRNVLIRMFVGRNKVLAEEEEGDARRQSSEATRSF